MKDTLINEPGESNAVESAPATRLIPETMFCATLLSIAAYLGFNSLYLGHEVTALYQQALVLILFGSAVVLNRLHWHRSWAKYVRCALVLGLISYLYSTLATVAFNHVPWLSDSMLFGFDSFLGFEALHTHIAPAITQSLLFSELLSLCYAAFIPYLLVSFYTHAIASPGNVRDLFLSSVAIMYAFGFLGYLFVPAYGPVVELAEQFGNPINGGFFHSLVTSSIDQAGGPHGAFPSLHMAGTMLMCVFDFRHGDRSRAWIYMPLVLLIAIATVVLRYHYVIDLIAGVAIAVVAMLISERLVSERPEVKPLLSEGE